MGVFQGRPKGTGMDGKTGYFGYNGKTLSPVPNRNAKVVARNVIPIANSALARFSDARFDFGATCFSPRYFYQGGN